MRNVEECSARGGADTYVVHDRQTVREEGRLDHQGEPLVLVPVAGLVSAYLADPDSARRDSCALGGVVQDLLGHPLGLRVSAA